MSSERPAASAGPLFTLVTRADCHLCEVMLAELGEYLARLRGEPVTTAVRRVTMLDVDASDQLRRQYGHKVPVLLLDGEVICHGRLDRAEVERLTRSVVPRI